MIELFEQAKSDLEIRMYKNISDAIRERLMFFATEKKFKGKKSIIVIEIKLKIFIIF